MTEGSVSLGGCYCRQPRGFSWSSGISPLSSPGRGGTRSLAPQMPWEGAGGLTICQSDRCFNLMKWTHAALSFRAVKFSYNSQNPPRASTSLPLSPHRCNLKVIRVLRQENDFFFFSKGGRGGISTRARGLPRKQKTSGVPLGYARN